MFNVLHHYNFKHLAPLIRQKLHNFSIAAANGVSTDWTHVFFHLCNDPLVFYFYLKPATIIGS